MKETTWMINYTNQKIFKKMPMMNISLLIYMSLLWFVVSHFLKKLMIQLEVFYWGLAKGAVGTIVKPVAAIGTAFGEAATKNFRIGVFVC